MTQQPVYQTESLLMEQYETIRQRSLNICMPLQHEDYVAQPILDVSPPKWHLGHTTWFFENFILAHHLEGYQIFDERLNWFFNSYYESQGPRIHRSKRGNMTRPVLQRVLDYRKHVDEYILRLFQKKGTDPSLQHLLTVGLQHEEQHQELLLTDIKYILGNNPLFPKYQTVEHPKQSAGRQDQNFLKIEEGIYEIGFSGQGFCWDNELGRHKVYLHEFAIQDRQITNQEYLAFIQDGGYKNHQFWLSEGWDWVNQNNIQAPEYWIAHEGSWKEYTLHQGLEALDLDAPVTHISLFEADAFARWAGMRLPTEFEWEAACALHGEVSAENSNFYESQNFHPIAANSNYNQFLGNTWEWTNSAYLPYPKYQAFEGALGEYNGKFMSNQMVLRGGSCATPRQHIRRSYRNFFQTDKRWQFTGLRLAKDL